MKGYKKPEAEILELTDQARMYLTEERNLSESVITQFGLGCSKKGEIIIPFYDDLNELRLIKYRSAIGEKISRVKRVNGEVEVIESKTFSEYGGAPILFGTHLCDPKKGPLVMCFGEYDAMSVAQDGVENCVSLPFGDLSHKFVELQWEFLDKFEEIILYPDNDKDPKVKKISDTKIFELATRLGRHKCKIVDAGLMREAKDANQLLVEEGAGINKELIENVIFYPEPGLIRLVDYKDVPYVEGTPTTWKDFDETTGGISDGELTIISGDNNAGKTTTILNLIAMMMSGGQHCFYWSGEQGPGKLRWWLEQILAGPSFIKSDISKAGREYFFADPEYIKKIRRWYQDLLYVLDKRGLTSEEFFEVCELVVRRYGCTKLFIDNLMAFTDQDEDYYGAQGTFTRSCKNFAEDWGCHVFLVTHNRKEDQGKIPDKDSVEGSKKITNWADNVIQVFRVPATMQNEGDPFQDTDTIIKLAKHRDSEKLVDLKMKFDRQSKRIVQLSEADTKMARFLGWENEEIKNLQEVMEDVVDEEFLLG